jgi:hypothetical protein
LDLVGRRHQSRSEPFLWSGGSAETGAVNRPTNSGLARAMES